MNDPGEKPEPEISREDGTPSVIDQAKVRGWDAAYYNFGKGEEPGVQYFNPGLVERPDGLWLLVRRSEPHPEGFRFGQNAVWAFLLDAEGKIPLMGKILKWPVENPTQHFEDARGFYHPDIHQTLVSACTFIWYEAGNWTGAHQCFGAFDENWLCKKMDYPKIGGNPGRMEKMSDTSKFEKNWIYFLKDNQLHLLYKSKPWLVVGFKDSWDSHTSYRFDEGVAWKWGDIRGGTNPVLVDGLYWTFHHSSLPWKTRYRRYYAGAMAFDAYPPFRPRLITPDPILAGSQNDEWVQRKPPCIFPCGAIYRNGKWLITCGVNDLKSAWVELPHKDILALARPIGQSSPSIFSANGLSEAEQKKERLRQRAAKARLALAEKRAKGLVVKRKMKRKRKKNLATTTA